MEKEDIEHLQKLLFTTSKPNERSHRCVVIFGKNRAVSYQHGTHSSFKKNDKVILYSVMKSTKIEVIVSVISERNDFIVFEAVNQEFPDYPCGSNVIYPGQKYLQLGIDQKTRRPAWKEGIISKRGVGFYLGTSHGERGDSGSGIFDMNGRFIGISVAKKDFAFSNLQISGPKIDYGELADHHPETKIISEDVILSYLDIEDDPDFLPPEKRKREVELE
ncbi:hypothetical protein FO519_010132 [Halicephalobus sp. NKZ332]|nr:hypothetical protein FO519_010132 [Halicephalobus sp. NKZ332]